EHSYARRWPSRLIFSCIRPAARGGETSIASVPAAMQRMRTETLARFRDEGVMYVRNFGGGLGLDWPTAPGTDDRRAVGACRDANGFEHRWLPDGPLQTPSCRPALRRPPGTEHELWFNHAFSSNVASLDAELRAALPEHADATDLPFATFYGSGAA